MYRHPIHPESISPRELYSPRGAVVCGLFVVAAVFFFFNFCQLRRTGVARAPLTGIELVTAAPLNLDAPAARDSPDDIRGGPGGDSGAAAPAVVFGSPALWAVLAFLAAVTGAMVFASARGRDSLAGVLAGTTGVVALLLLQWAIRMQLAAPAMVISGAATTFLFGYWAAFAAFAVAAATSYLWLGSGTRPAAPAHPSTAIHISIISSGEDASSRE